MCRRAYEECLKRLSATASATFLPLRQIADIDLSTALPTGSNRGTYTASEWEKRKAKSLIR